MLWIACDGSCLGNPGPGGWAAVILTDTGEERVLSGGEPDTTNNRMELTAAIRAVEAVPDGARATVFCDSQYVVKGITQWLPSWVRRNWQTANRRPVKNTDLWRRLADCARPAARGPVRVGPGSCRAPGERKGPYPRLGGSPPAGTADAAAPTGAAGSFPPTDRLGAFVREYRFLQADVFTDRAFAGNPLAIVTGAEGLSGEEMQRIAAEMNLSETAFVLPPTAVQALCRLRIFTPNTELPLAGHPVVGTFFVLARRGELGLGEALRNLGTGVHRIHQECGAGVLPVDIRVSGGEVEQVVMTQAPPRFFAEFTDRSSLARLPRESAPTNSCPTGGRRRSSRRRFLS